MEMANTFDWQPPAPPPAYFFPMMMDAPAVIKKRSSKAQIKAAKAAHNDLGPLGGFPSALPPSPNTETWLYNLIDHSRRGR